MGQQKDGKLKKDSKKDCQHGAGRHDEIGKKPIARQTSEVMGDEGSGAEGGGDGDHDDAPHVAGQMPRDTVALLTEQLHVGHGEQRHQAWAENEDARHCHERHLKTYIKKPLGIVYQQQRGSKYQYVVAMRRT